MIEVGNIVKNLSSVEAVTITRIRKLGKNFSLDYTGVYQLCCFALFFYIIVFICAGRFFSRNNPPENMIEYIDDK